MVRSALTMAEGGRMMEVLCCFKDHRRSVTFSGNLIDLKEQLKKKFQGVLPKNCEICLQMKDENWSGQFTDISEDKDIVDKSILNVVVEKQEVIAYYLL